MEYGIWWQKNLYIYILRVGIYVWLRFVSENKCILLKNNLFAFYLNSCVFYAFGRHTDRHKHSISNRVMLAKKCFQKLSSWIIAEHFNIVCFLFQFKRIILRLLRFINKKRTISIRSILWFFIEFRQFICIYTYSSNDQIKNAQKKSVNVSGFTFIIWCQRT